jgi:hypothetical protein
MIRRLISFTMIFSILIQIIFLVLYFSNNLSNLGANIADVIMRAAQFSAVIGFVACITSITMKIDDIRLSVIGSVLCFIDFFLISIAYGIGSM